MSNLSHRRTHNLLLISKLLNQRDHVSPLTLILDSLEQPAKPLLQEYLRRARLGKTFTLFLAFDSLRKPEDVDRHITCWDKTPVQISQAVSTALSSAATSQRCLILVDSMSNLADLSTDPNADFNLTSFLSSLLQPPQKASAIAISVVAVYHQDILPARSSHYMPAPVVLLSYLATTIIHVHSLAILLAEKEATNRSVAAPSFGLEENVEGIVIGLKTAARPLSLEQQGIVLELEHRRKSGRGVHEWYFLPQSASKQAASLTPQSFREVVTILDDHPAFRKPRVDIDPDNDLADMTFSLGLTDRQKQDREGVVLPYFDAQNPQGSGGIEGGRILYDMGVEDDFDDEEDEI